MSFNASIERKTDTQEIVSIGLVGFDYDKVAENYQATEICITPLGIEFDVLNHLTDNDFDFRVPFATFLDKNGEPSSRGHDSISTYGPQQIIEARKIVAGLVSIGFLGTNPTSQPLSGIQLILKNLGSPLESRWIDEEVEEEMPAHIYSWETAPCTVEELENGLSVLRFNFNGVRDTKGHNVMYDLDSFTQLALAESNITL